MENSTFLIVCLCVGFIGMTVGFVAILKAYNLSQKTIKILEAVIEKYESDANMDEDDEDVAE